MINTRVPLSGNDELVVKSTVHAVINDIKGFLNVSSNTHYIVESNEIFKNDNWNIGDIQDTKRNGPQDDMIVIGWDESYDDVHSITTKLYHNDTKPVIDDPITGLKIRTLYAETIVKIRIKILSKSKTHIKSLLTKLRLMYIGNHDLSEHTIQYLYSLPKPLTTLIDDIYLIRDSVYNDGKGVEEFLIPMIDDRFTIIGDQTGTLAGVDIGFKELQTRVQGYFTNDLLNSEKSFEEKDNYWYTDLEYEFRFDKPTALDLTYNQIVYNTPMPLKYIQMRPLLSDSVMSRFTPDQFNINRFHVTTEVQKIMNNIRRNETYLRIPSFDIHQDYPVQNHMIHVFSVLATISPTDRRFLFNLTELGEYELVPEILDFIRAGEYQYLTQYLNSVFNIELYVNDVFTTNIEIVVDSDLNVYSTVDLSLDKVYRIVFNVIINTSVLYPAALARLKERSNLVNKIINIIKLINGEEINENTIIIDGSVLETVNKMNVTVSFQSLQKARTNVVILSYIIALHMRSLQ